MKKWNAPEVESLDVKLTASNGVESDHEANGSFATGWVAYRNASEWESCGTEAGSSYKKNTTES